MPQICHRCGEELAPEGLPLPAFCSHCGAPQLELSSDLFARHVTLEAAADSVQAATTGTRPPPHPRHIRWRVALEGALVVSAVAAVFWLLALRISLFGVLCWFWIMSASLLTLEIYRRREPAAMVNARVGARVGLVVGVALNAAFAVTISLVGPVARFVTHSMGPMDGQIAAALQAQRAQAATVPDQAEVLRLLGSPEFRAGFVLLALALGAAFLLVLCMVTGALAGALGPRRPVRS